MLPPGRSRNTLVNVVHPTEWSPHSGTVPTTIESKVGPSAVADHVHTLTACTWAGGGATRGGVTWHRYTVKSNEHRSEVWIECHGDKEKGGGWRWVGINLENQSRLHQNIGLRWGSPFPGTSLDMGWGKRGVNKKWTKQTPNPRSGRAPPFWWVCIPKVALLHSYASEQKAKSSFDDLPLLSFLYHLKSLSARTEGCHAQTWGISQLKTK